MNTTQTDTPETDAEVERLRLLRYHCAPQNDPKLGADFARKLERERDAALKRSAEWEELFHRFGRKSREMETERDAALRELAELRKDKERLDWLDKHTALHGSTLHAKVRQPSINSTLRESIDLEKEAQ